MKLKTSGAVDKFQIMNRRGQPILQTGMRNGSRSSSRRTMDPGLQSAIKERKQLLSRRLSQLNSRVREITRQH
jgi:hypothetical protein